MDETLTPIAARSWGRANRSSGWFDRLWTSIAESGRRYLPDFRASMPPVERALTLAEALLSRRGEASGAAIAHELLAKLAGLDLPQRLDAFDAIARLYGPDPARLTEAARAYLADPGAATESALTRAAEPPRQELLRRMNMAPGGTAALVGMRRQVLEAVGERPSLRPLESDLKHLFKSWFNRGFLELRRIDWETPASVLEKLIVYEAVHEIDGWDDLRRRLGRDRRCFAFFHPALPGEPLIFVEVALTDGLAGAMAPLLERDRDDEARARSAARADTAIFYSISNCQDGLRGISFGNFLIKQVVEELKDELPGLRRFATLSPVPGLRKWLESGAADEPEIDLSVLPTEPGLWLDDPAAERLRPVLLRLCARYLTRPAAQGTAIDSVARFHLGNGARLERLNWMANTAPRGIAESFGIMVNYLYDPDTIDDNHERFASDGSVARSAEVDAILNGKIKRWRRQG